MDESEWTRKGATLSNTSAEKELGLTWADVVSAIQAGTLQYREGSMHGNPWLRLLRREVEALVSAKCGAAYLKDQKAKTELGRIDPGTETAEKRDRDAAREEGEAAGLMLSRYISPTESSE